METIYIDRLTKLALGLKELPETWRYDIGLTSIRDSEDKSKVVGGCAWGYAPEVFPDELTRDTGSGVPLLVKNTSTRSYQDCSTFFGITDNQRQHLFQDCGTYFPDETADETADKILALCEELKEPGNSPL